MSQTTGMSGRNGHSRLNGWKEIASFFGKDERTVKRWEAQHGLPVRRVPGGNRGTVYADVAELDTWLGGRKAPFVLDVPETGITPPPEHAATTAGSVPHWAGHRAVVVLGLAALLAAGVFAGNQFRPDQPLRLPSAEEVPAVELSLRDLYLDGLYNLSTRTPAGLSRAVQDFTQIVSRDPTHAEAHAQLAIAYNLLTQYALMPADLAYPQAKAAAERAIRLNDGLAPAYAALGFAEHYWYRDFAKARGLFAKAIELDPSSAQARHWFALTRMQAGDFAAAQSLIDRAQELDPDSRAIVANRALILFHGGRSGEALAALQQLEATAPGSIAAQFYMATINLDLGRYDAYLARSLQAARLQDNQAMLQTFTAGEAGYRRGGAAEMFSAMLAVQKESFDGGLEQAFNVARTAGMLGDRATMFDYLAKSVERNEQDMLGIRIDRSFAKFWDDEEFRDVAAKVGLPFPEEQVDAN